MPCRDRYDKFIAQSDTLRGRENFAPEAHPCMLPSGRQALQGIGPSWLFLSVCCDHDVFKYFGTLEFASCLARLCTSFLHSQSIYTVVLLQLWSLSRRARIESEALDPDAVEHKRSYDSSADWQLMNRRHDVQNRLRP